MATEPESVRSRGEPVAFLSKVLKLGQIALPPSFSKMPTAIVRG